MKSVIDDWYNSKKKTYHHTWDVEDGIAWVLFITDEVTGTYYHGVESSVEKAQHEIKWAIGSYLKSARLL